MNEDQASGFGRQGKASQGEEANNEANNNDSEGGKPPLPEARSLKPTAHPEPTRYGDWEINGKCVDF